MTHPPIEDAVTAVRSRVLVMRIKRGAIELAFLSVLYVAYCASRMLASDAFAPARGRALDILDIEKDFRIDVERWLNHLFVNHDWLGLVGSFWYATTHYVVTVGILIWLYRRSATMYVTARRALVVATLIGLVFYLTMPTAPPRLVGGHFVDVLALHSADGWWGADASAPKGLGQMTNELAAFPSLHAGWALWAAIVLVRVGVPRIVQVIGFLYAILMTVDIIGTGNHWVLDAVVGWIVVLIGFAVVTIWERRSPVIAHEDG